MEEAEIVKILVEEGEGLNRSIALRMNDTVKEYKNEDVFVLSILMGISIAGYANWDDNYISNGLVYFKTGKKRPLKGLLKSTQRFGPETLKDAITMWREIYIAFKEKYNIDFSVCSVKNIVEAQKDMLNTAGSLIDNKEAKGVGPWLFCFPFKTLAAYRMKLWGKPGFDDILMPLGFEVIRGIRKITRKRLSFAQSYDTSLFQEEEGGLKEGMGTVYLSQGFSGKIAKIAGSNVIHINSGLFLLGSGDIELT